MAQFGSIAGEIESRGADLVAVAVSATFSQMAFARELQIGFPLLSDWDGEVCASFGVQYDSWKGHAGLAKRAIFVIDGGGTIAYSWHTDNAEELPDLQPVLEALATVG